MNQNAAKAQLSGCARFKFEFYSDLIFDFSNGIFSHYEMKATIPLRMKSFSWITNGSWLEDEGSIVHTRYSVTGLPSQVYRTCDFYARDGDMQITFRLNLNMFALGTFDDSTRIAFKFLRPLPAELNTCMQQAAVDFSTEWLFFFDILHQAEAWPSPGTGFYTYSFDLETKIPGEPYLEKRFNRPVEASGFQGHEITNIQLFHTPMGP